MTEGTFEGGCLCEEIRFRVAGPALQTSCCHCTDCRKASGAPFVAWTFFAVGSLTWLRGTPKILHHADRERSFCGDCGTPLIFYDPALPQLFEVNTCTFDDPHAHSPVDQCWLTDEIHWTPRLAGLPRFDFTSPLP